MQAEWFGPYRLEELIGRGGMGEVFRATDTARKRVVALKRLPASLAADPSYQRRFRSESEIAAQLRSAHVIPIHDYGEIDGQLYIDMRLVNGEDVADRLNRSGPMSAHAAVDVIRQTASALDAAHAMNLIHRDVKPSNILLSPEDGRDGHDFVYLVDFGIARAADRVGELTGTGGVMGTPDYMAPERFEGRPRNPNSQHTTVERPRSCVKLMPPPPSPAGTLPRRGRGRPHIRDRLHRRHTDQRPSSSLLPVSDSTAPYPRPKSGRSSQRSGRRNSCYTSSAETSRRAVSSAICSSVGR